MELSTFHGVVLAHLVLSGLIATLTEACDFPEFMHTNNTQRDWRGRIKEQYTEFTVQMYVDAKTLRSIATDSSVRSFTWICLQMQSQGRYMVAHEESGQQSTRYTCVEFVKRSDNVVQIRSADVGDSMDSALCSDSAMKLDPWVFVDKTHVADDVHVCALEGGFSIRVYDKLYQQGVCDGYHGEIRLESECLSGEGLFFYFRKQSCVPDSLYMYFTQRTLCLANWEEGPYTFMLIRHDIMPQYMWIMRYPTRLTTQSFMAFLFKDFVADMETPVKSTANYLRLDVVRDSVRPISALCVDDYEVCSVWRRPCSADAQMALTCSRTCSLCNATRPNVCAFPNAWQGTWYDSTRTETPAISTDMTTMTVHGQVEEKFYCVDWDPTPPNERNRNTKQQMLVAEFHNGCKPRYTCAQVTQQSANAQMLQMSQTLRWPFTSTLEEPIDCQHFTYDRERTFLDNRYRTKNPRLLLLSKEELRDVDCDLPDIPRNMIATFKDGAECEDTSVEESAGGKSLQVNLSPGCTGQLSATLFQCVESTRTQYRDLVIVTHSAVEKELFCWVFPRRPRSTFYLLAANQCNDALRRRMRNARLDPLVTFSKRSLQENEDSDGNLSTGGDDLRNPSSQEPSDVNRRTKPPTTSTEGDDADPSSGEEEGSSSSIAPYVVIATVIIFALLQIPCMCKPGSS